MSYESTQLTRTIVLGLLLVAYGSIVFWFEGSRYPSGNHINDITNSVAAVMSQPSGEKFIMSTNIKDACAEIVTFEIFDTISKEDFVQAATEANAALQEFNGFLSRTLTVDDDGKQWMDYVVWADRDSALYAGKEVVKDPRFGNFLRSIVETSIDMKHSTVQLRV